MNDDKLRAARHLAEAHSRIDPDVREIFLLESSDESDMAEPIKLLEVVEGAFEAGVEPIGFSANPARGEDYPSVIVEISPREYELLPRPIRFGDKVWRITQTLVSRSVEV